MNREQSNRWAIRGGLLTSAAIALFLASPAEAFQQQRYDIPAGDAAQNVQALAVQSNVQVIAPNADLAGVRTRPVNGTYEPLEAMRIMLAETGLEAVPGDDGAILVRRSGENDADERTAVAEDGSQIIVTGTRIARAGVDTIQAATVTDAAEIERRAYTNVIQALQDTPGFAPAANSQIGTSQANLGIAQSFANFFGLGSQRTLSLVNGRRFVSSNTVSGAGSATSPGSQVDVNLIPVGLVERIETVAIGGAPVYGSDAIAGTVNFILKNDFEGLEFDAQASISERGDAANQTVRGLWGHNFMDGRGNIVLGAEYSRQEGMKLNNRLPLFLALVSSGNTNRTDGIPALQVIDQRIAILTEGGLPFRSGAVPSDATFITVDGRTVAQGGTPLQFGFDGGLIPFVRGTNFPGDGGAFRNGGDGLNPADHALLLSPNERMLFNALGNFDVTPGINLFFEGSYANTQGVKLSDLFQFAAPGVGGPALEVRASNAFLSNEVRAILARNGITGDQSFRINRNLNDIADRRPASTELDVYRIVVGARGEFAVGGTEWDWDLSYNYGRSENTSEFNQINQTRFLAAIDAVNVGGSIQCRSGGSCIPLNIFGQNAFSDEAAAAVIDKGIGISVNELEEVQANVGGRLPFGIAAPIAFSIGAAHRKESGSFTGNDIINNGLTLLNGQLGYPDAPKRGFTTNEVYGETRIPLIDDDMNLPLIRAAEFEGAIRYVDHSVAGGDITWSAGGRISPRLGSFGDGLVLRGVYTRAIRSPGIVELFLNSTPVLRSANDVCASTRVNSGPNPAVRLANCTAALAAVGAPAPSAFTPTTNGSSPPGIVGGNPDLENEKARSWSIGAVWQPTFVPRLRISVDYSKIKLRDAISRFTLITAQSACYDSPNYPNEGACNAFRRLTAAEAAAQSAATGRARIAGDIADGYLESYFNSARFDFEGIIGEVDYRIPFVNFMTAGGEEGAVRLGLKFFHINSFRTQTSGASPIIEAAGAVGSPKWRLNGRVGIALDPIDFDVQVLWNSAVVGDPALTIEDTPINDYGEYTLVNTTLGFKVDERMRLQFSVRNLFDKQLPYAAQVTRQFSVFDPIGRVFTASASLSF